MKGKLGKALLLLALLCCAQGCYEGWDRPPVGGGNGPSTPVTPTPPPPKIYGYALFQPIMMAPSAVGDDACFPKTGIREFKSTEWSERVGEIQLALGDLADTVVVKPVQIDASDCDAVTAIGAEAVKGEPWDTDVSPEDDTSGKPDLHLTAALWEGEPASTPPVVVTAPSWAAWTKLTNEGRTAISLRYFVISNPINGYFTLWQAALPATEVLAGTPIDTVDPTDSGAAGRDAQVKTDTTAVSTWILKAAMQ